VASHAKIVQLPVRPVRVVDGRTWGDRMARWYVGVTAVGVAVWLGTGQAVTVPAACAPVEAPTEACVWLDGQRSQLQREVGKVADTQRPFVAQRLSDLASLVGSGAAAR
jgi:hypothetical protein